MLFSLITFIIYLDRGVIASNGVQGDSPGRQGIQVAAQASRNGLPETCIKSLARVASPAEH